jgi:hypothetical protein
LDTATANPVNPEHAVISSDETAQIQVVLWQLARRVFTVNAATATTINLQTFWFPGWQATVNGQAVETQADVNDGTIEFPIPAGTSDIEVRFENTPIRTTGGVISLLAANAVAGVIVFDFSRRGRVGSGN